MINMRNAITDITTQTPDGNRRLLLVTRLILLLTAVIPAGELRVNTQYLWDGIVTSVLETRLAYIHRINDALALRGEMGYLNATQDRVSGISRLHAEAGWVSIGGTWLTLWKYALVEAEGGIDILSDNRIAPAGKASINTGIPLPANPVVQNLRLKPTIWYTQRHGNAAAIKTRITSRGFEGEATLSMIAQRVDIGCSYRLENLVPNDTVLDSTFLDTISSGRPSLPIRENMLYNFYVYAVSKICPFLQAGYAFSWADCDEDRWIATRLEPMPWPFIGQLIQYYAYYPYPTQCKSFAHLLVAVIPVSIGPVALLGKIAFPFYSQREIFSYSQKFTGPLSMELKTTWAATTHCSMHISYAYYSLPYDEWKYFTRDSYSYNTIMAGASIYW
jgi:hypothetical protein